MERDRIAHQRKDPKLLNLPGEFYRNGYIHPVSGKDFKVTQFIR
jgi:hypothetical protein